MDDLSTPTSEADGKAGGAEGGGDAEASAGAGEAEEDAAPVAEKPLVTVMQLPEVRLCPRVLLVDAQTSRMQVLPEEAADNVGKVIFDGKWFALFQFLVVDIGSQRKDAVVSGIAVGACVHFSFLPLRCLLPSHFSPRLCP